MKRSGWLIAAFAVLTLLGCGKQENTPSATGDPNALVVLAGSELKDIEPLLGRIAEKTGVRLAFRYAGTLDIVERIAGGEAADMVWVSHGKYLQLTPGARERVKAAEKTMLSPVVLGLREGKARELGWCGNTNVTWADIAKAAEAGKFSFAMTNPASSNSGFTALVGLTAALAGNPDAISVADIKEGKTSAFFRAQRLTAGSSGWLAETYARDSDRVDGLINYESVLLSLNAGNQLKEKLCLIYPKEGIVSADYPLMLVNDSKRADYDKLVAYLRSAEFQQLVMSNTLRRPVNPDVKLSNAFPATVLVELPFPGKLEVIDALLDGFLNDIRLPAHSWFVLDTSGSMAGQGISQLKASLATLAGQDTSLSGRFARFQKREQISVIQFSSEPQPVREFDMGQTDASNRETLTQFSAYAASLQADGGTAIYDSVIRAYVGAITAQQRERGQHYQTIVLMTDGKNTEGRNFEAFRAWYFALPEAERTVRVFTVAFADADLDELRRLAELTGGRVFDGRKGDLKAIFKEIRGYQ